jgi:hypothetical protein
MGEIEPAAPGHQELAPEGRHLLEHRHGLARRRATVSAAISPAGPPPITATSKTLLRSRQAASNIGHGRNRRPCRAMARRELLAQA